MESMKDSLDDIVYVIRSMTTTIMLSYISQLKIFIPPIQSERRSALKVLDAKTGRPRSLNARLKSCLDKASENRS